MRPVNRQKGCICCRKPYDARPPMPISPGLEEGDGDLDVLYDLFFPMQQSYRHSALADEEGRERDGENKSEPLKTLEPAMAKQVASFAKARAREAARRQCPTERQVQLPLMGMFEYDELKLGSLLGVGGFSHVREIKAFDSEATHFHHNPHGTGNNRSSIMTMSTKDTSAYSSVTNLGRSHRSSSLRISTGSKMVSSSALGLRQFTKEQRMAREFLAQHALRTQVISGAGESHEVLTPSPPSPPPCPSRFPPSTPKDNETNEQIGQGTHSIGDDVIKEEEGDFSPMVMVEEDDDTESDSSADQRHGVSNPEVNESDGGQDDESVDRPLQAPEPPPSSETSQEKLQAQQEEEHQHQQQQQTAYPERTLGRYAVKHLRYSLINNPEKFAKAAMDLACEGEMMLCLDHPNIVKLRGWASGGPGAYREGKHTSYFLIVDRLLETLQDRIWFWRKQWKEYHTRPTCCPQFTNPITWLRRILLPSSPPKLIGPENNTQHRRHRNNNNNNSSENDDYEEDDDDYEEDDDDLVVIEENHNNVVNSSREGGIEEWTQEARFVHSLLIERLRVLYDISCALEYLHDKRIIYRDLKTSNIGFDLRGDCKIFDFGLSRFLPKSTRNNATTKTMSTTATTNATGAVTTMTTTTNYNNNNNNNNSGGTTDDDEAFRMSNVGTRRYTAPEVDNKLPYNLKADVYSFGVVMWEVLSMSSPRSGKKSSKKQQQQKKKYQQQKNNYEEKMKHHRHHATAKNNNNKQQQQHTKKNGRQYQHQNQQQHNQYLQICSCWPKPIQVLVQSMLLSDPIQRPNMKQVRSTIKDSIVMCLSIMEAKNNGTYYNNNSNNNNGSQHHLSMMMNDMNDDDDEHCIGGVRRRRSTFRLESFDLEDLGLKDLDLMNDDANFQSHTSVSTSFSN